MQYELYILPETLVKYRVHQSNISGIKPETIIRHHFELSQLLKRYFCQVVYHNLLAIFPDCLESGEQFEPSLADFLLARYSLKVKRSPHQYLGLETLFNLLGDPEKARLIQHYYQFDASDLANLTKSYDIFNLKNQDLKRPLNVISSPSDIPQQSPLPLVSLIIPTYNGESFLAEALESAIAQTYPHLEIIISDDGSTDNTLNIAQTFQQKNTIPVQILAHSNYGLVENLNFSVSQAKGKYIKFLFQDDLLEPNCIQTMVDVAEQDDEIGLVFSPRRVFIEPNSQLNSACQKALRGVKEIHRKWANLKSLQLGQDLLADANCLKGQLNKIGEPTTVLIPKAVFEKIGNFDNSLHQLLDGDLWFRIMGNYKIAFVNQTLSSLRIHCQQQTQKNISEGQNLKDYQRLYQKMLFHPDYHFLDETFKVKIFAKLIAKTKEYFPLTQTLIQQYQTQFFDLNILDYLNKIRQIIVQCWLSLPTEELEPAYQGDLGQTHRALIDSDLLEEQQIGTEQSFVQEIIQQVAQGFQTDRGIQAILAAMLYQKAYQLPLNYQNAAIPQYLFPDFLAFLFAEVRICPELEAIQQYFKFIENLLNYIYQHLFSNPTHPTWLYIASIYAQINPGEIWKVCPPELNLKSLLSYRANIIELYLQQTGYQLESPDFSAKSPPYSRIFWGILVDEIGFNPDTFAIIPILKKIDLTKFKPLLYTFSIENVNLEILCQDWKTQPILLPEPLSEAASQIRRDSLDILLIGSDVTARTTSTYKLALHRVARKQILSGNHLLTSGIRNIDHILAGELTQAATEPQRYREQVITLKGSGLCWSYPAQLPNTRVQLTRQNWGATAETIIFAVTGKISAIAAEFRQMWSQILAAVPQSILVLLPQASTHHNQPLRPFFHQVQSQLIQREIKPERLVMVEPINSRTNLRKCLEQVDLYLDLFPSYDPISLLEALQVGVVPVVYAGQTPLHRQSAALLQELGIPELITSTTQAYIQLSIQLGTQPEYRQKYRQQIQDNLQKNPPFLDSQAYTQQLETIIKTLLGSVVAL